MHQQASTDLRRRMSWTEEEDCKLKDWLQARGPGNWDILARESGLIGRSGNSCRHRWFNYLSPEIRRGNITNEEMLLILQLHSELGNQWSKIALKLRRTDNEIKNFWNSRIKKEAKQLGLDVDKEEEEFVQLMRQKYLRTRNQAAAVAGGIDGTSADDAYMDALHDSHFPDINGGSDGTTAISVPPSLTASTDHEPIMMMLPPPSSPSYFTTPVDHANIGAAVTSPSYFTPILDHTNIGAAALGTPTNFTTTADHPTNIGAAIAPPSYFPTTVYCPDIGDLDNSFWSS